MRVELRLASDWRPPSFIFHETAFSKTYQRPNVPVIVEALRGKRVALCSAGMHHTMAMLDNGDVYTWGSGEYGRLGHDDEQMQTTPLLVELLVGKSTKEISAGGFHSLVLAAGGDEKRLHTHTHTHTHSHTHKLTHSGAAGHVGTPYQPVYTHTHTHTHTHTQWCGGTCRRAL